MKKVALSIVGLLVMSFAVIPASAQTRSRCANNSTSARRYDHSNGVYNNQVYRNNNQVYRNNGQIYRSNQVYQNDNYVYDNSPYANDGYYDNRSTWERSRDKITTAIGAGAGAATGAMIGGKKGAIVGAITGGGAAALYTYVLRDRNDYRY